MVQDCPWPWPWPRQHAPKVITGNVANLARSIDVYDQNHAVKSSTLGGSIACVSIGMCYTHIVTIPIFSYVCKLHLEGNEYERTALYEVGVRICRVVHALHSLSKSLFCVLIISIKSRLIFDSRVYFVLQ